MKKTTFFTFLIGASIGLFSVYQGSAQNFVTTWETTIASETITIPTESGETYLYDVDWDNDGTFDAIGITGDASNTYLLPGVHTVTVRGTFPRIFFNNTGDKDKIIIINEWGANQWSSMANAFEGCTNLVIAALDTPDLTLATDLSAMFKDAVAINQDISTWSVGTITNMANMFNGATSFDQNIGTWNVSAVTDMTNMFANAGLGINNYDALLIGWAPQPLQNSVSFNAGTSEFCFGATAKSSMEATFMWTITDAGENCTDFFTTTWQTDNPGTSASNQITIPTTGAGYNYEIDWGDGSININVLGDITHTYPSAGMYTVKIRGSFPGIYFNDGGDKEKILSVENWGANSWTSMEAAFFGCINLAVNATDAPDLSGATSLAQTFKGATAFNNTINSWDVSTIMNLTETFSQAINFNQDLSGWTTTAVELMDATFSQSGFNMPIDAWDVSNVISMESMFAESPYNQPLSSWTTTSLLSMDSMFANNLDFNQDISSWNVSSVTNMQGVFLNAQQFNMPLASWVVTSAQTMEGMFSSAEMFNQPIGTWTVNSVTNMSGMFTNAISYNQDISLWDVGMVTNMSNMFSGAEVFDQDLSGWDVGQVTDMSFMFAGAEVFNQDISGWITTSVTTTENMFNNALLFNQDIGGWNVSMVNTMEEMFTAAEAFDQDIGSWDITNVTAMDNMFTGVTMSIANYDALLIGWNAQGVQNGIFFNGGNSRYCDGEDARDNLITNNGWNITDAGAENIPPIPDSATLTNVTSECAVMSLPAPTATDACAGVLTGTTAAFPIINQGTTIITWTYDDANGNIFTQEQQVTITDATPPSIDTPGVDETASTPLDMCGAFVTYGVPVFSDNCDFTVTSTHNPGDFFSIGETTVVYIATDTAGNSTEETVLVTVTDTIAPVFTGCPSSFTIDTELGSCGAIVNFTAPTASDNCFASVISTHNSGQFFPVGVTTVTYTAFDSGGNTAMCSFNIIVADTVNPVFSQCPSNLTVNNDFGSCNTSVFYTTPVATDNCNATLTSTHNPGDLFPVGATTVIYTATDTAGNTQTCSFTVTVIDNSDPVISSCPFDIAQNADAGTCTAVVSWTPPLQTDNCSAILTSTHNPGDVFTAGDTTVTYTATDPSGNTATCVFTVTISENEAPVISNCPTNVSVSNDIGACGAIVSFIPPTQTDNCGANFTSSHVPGDFFPVGNTTVQYVATDTSGNTATCSFVITVLDAEDPIFTSCPTDITITNDLGSCDALVFWTPPVSVDNCSANVTASHNPGDGFQLGTTLVTYTATDAAGNSVICSFNVTVEDTEMPVITNCPAAIVVGNDFGDCDANVSWTAPLATDNCVSLTFTSSHASGDMFPVGTTTVTYTATDAVGNASNCSFTVTVQDTEIPDIDCPTDTSVFVNFVDYVVPDYVAEGLVAITDNCTATLTNVVQTPPPGSMLPVGSYPVSIVVNDDALNEATCTFTLSVEAVLGVEDKLDVSSLSVYPNPMQTDVILSNPQYIPIIAISLYDVVGRLVKKYDRNEIQVETILDVYDLASGTYLMLVTTEVGQITKQLIKE